MHHFVWLERHALVVLSVGKLAMASINTRDSAPAMSFPPPIVANAGSEVSQRAYARDTKGLG